MRATITAAALVSLIGVKSAAADEAVGRIKIIEPVKHSITLADGQTFLLSSSIYPTDLRVGEKVRIVFAVVGHRNRASSVVGAR